MKQKLLTLFTLLLTVCSGAWAQTTFDFSEGSTTGLTIEKSGTVANVEYAVTNEKYASKISPLATGNYFLGMNFINGGGGILDVTTTESFSNIESISFDTAASDNGKPTMEVFIVDANDNETKVLASMAVSSGSTNTWRSTKSTVYTIDLSSSPKTGKVHFKFTSSSSSKVGAIDNIVITEAAPATPTLTGAWKVGGETVASGTIYQGNAVPSLSLSVDASDDSHPAAGKYNVVYSKEGDDVVEITNEGAGFTLKNNVTGTATLKATITATGDDYKDAAGTINYEYTVNPKTPTLNLDKEEVTLKSTPLARNAQTTVTLTGAFLAGVSGTVSTDGTTGLSISPEVFTISEGTVAETEFTITYNSDSGNSGDATITFTDGNINKELTVHYTSVIPHEWTTVSEATTWDWSDITVSGDEFKLTESTTPKKSEFVSEYVVATDFDGDVYPMNVNFPEKFSSIKMSAFEYAARSANGHKIFQGTYLKLKTSVPGYISVYYLGTNTTARRININGTVCGEATENNSTLKKAENIFVPAGEITLCGDENNNAAYLRYNKIVFTPADAITVTTAGLATYASNYNLDFSEVTGIKAYRASISDKTITFNKVVEVPAGEGMLIRAMSDLDAEKTFYVPHKASASPIENAMKRGEGTAVAYNPAIDIYNYVLSGGDYGVGFYRANGETVPTDRAYLQSTAALAKGFVINYDDEEGEETDGIKAVSTKVENGVRYNLAGQKVGADYKGIVIVNGKKVIIK